MATMAAAKTLTIKLPKPHGKQIAFRNSRAKRKVVCAGRRGGKTTGMVLVAIEAMLAGRRVLEAAPTSDQTDTFWHGCCQALTEPIKAGIVRKNETQRILELPSVPLAVQKSPNPNLMEALKVDTIPRLPRIRCKTAHDADSLRGDYADLLILDEFAIMKANAWTEVGAPMLLDNNGDAVFIFTPKSLNHAHTLYSRAVGDESGRWEAFHFTSFDNPYLSKEALAEITSDMTEPDYQQEILAQFLQGEGAVFRNIEACLRAVPTTPAAHHGHRIVIGLDWGQKNDFTALSVFCATCSTEVELDRFNKIEWGFQRDRVKTKYDKWGVTDGLVELNSIGSPNFEALHPDCPTLRGFETTASSKRPLIQGLALALEKESAQWLNDPVAKAELLAYESKVSAIGHTSYSAPEGGHDDTVMARALAWLAANTSNEFGFTEWVR
jgi:hypothetical protein